MVRIRQPLGGERTQARGRPRRTARGGRRPSGILAALWLLLVGLGLVLPRDLVYAQSTITFETVATATDNTGNATSLAISKPTGTAEDDLLIAVVSVDGSETFTPPAGWTEIDQGQCASSACTLGVWRLAAGASEPSSYTFTLASPKKVVGAILRYSNAHVESNVIDVSGSATGTDTAPTAPSVTTTVANTLVLRVISNDDDDLDPASVPGGTTGRFALETTGGGSEGGAGADAQQASIGATGTAAFTLDATEEWRALTIVLKPLQSTTIVADQAMTEENLDARSLTITLADTAFIDSTLLTSNFTLNNAPTGTTVESVTHNSSTNATVALAFDGTDFDVDVTTFSVTGVGAATAAVERARDVGGAEAAWLRFPNPDAGSLVVRVDSTLSDEASRHVREAAAAYTPPSGASAAALLYYAEARRSGDVPADIRRMALGAELESVLIWPLVVRDRLTGDLALLRRESEGFTPAQITTSGAFARFIGPLLLLPTAPALGAASEPSDGAGEAPGAESLALDDLAGRVVEGLPVPALVEGADGAVAAANHAFGHTFNADPAALTGASFQTVVVPTIVRMVENETDAAQVMRTLRSGPRVRREHAIELRGGRGGPVIYRAYPLEAGQSQVIGRMHVFAPDLTDRD